MFGHLGIEEHDVNIVVMRLGRTRLPFLRRPEVPATRFHGVLDRRAHSAGRANDLRPESGRVRRFRGLPQIAGVRGEDEEDRSRVTGLDDKPLSS